ncbi:hypothetical protein F4776DRAFT_373113 [Hypoxylon sp. NC0597]|nr:hypothetical protein F4776DRAFT_373113 [Hypoxylon sp. NC0597]
MNGSGALNRSRLSPNPPGAHDDSSYNAALKGASLAFQKSSPKPLPPSTPTSRNVDNRALIAATSAASASRDHSRTISRQTTGSSIQGGNGDPGIEQGGVTQSSAQRLQPPSQWNLGTSSHLGPASRPTMPDPRSPSFIAATLAASRSVSPARNQVAQSQPYSPQLVGRQRQYSVGDSTASSVKSLDLATDTTSIPSTNALISMFEKRKDDMDPVKKGVTADDSQKSLGAESKPRALSPPRTTGPITMNELSPSRLASSPVRRNVASPSPTVAGPSQERRQKPQDAFVEAKARPPTPPPARAKNKAQESAQPVSLEVKGKPRASTPPPKSISRANTVILSPKPKRPVPQKILLNDITAQDAVPEGQTSPPGKSKQYPPSPVHNVAEESVPRDDSRRTSTSSNDTFVSASSVPSPHAGSPERGRSRPSSPDTVRLRRPPSAQTVSTITTSAGRPPPLPRRHTQQPTSNLPLESLTDAIMAGSLASSRLTPAKTPPPKPPSHKQTPHMRQTLRQPPSKSDDEGESRARSRRRKPLGKLAGGNKHAHHEGARKRWREEITPRERKRYEGVWASNRGLLLVAPNNSSSSSIFNGQLQPYPQAQTQSQSQAQTQTPAQALEKEMEQGVANVIVRDIWARSRLPFDELAEVWDLVDRRGLGFLDRTEFVVGMWLIDQRLRGRKIPRK